MYVYIATLRRTPGSHQRNRLLMLVTGSGTHGASQPCCGFSLHFSKALPLPPRYSLCLVSLGDGHVPKNACGMPTIGRLTTFWNFHFMSHLLTVRCVVQECTVYPSSDTA